jgi:hypothetical protein
MASEMLSGLDASYGSLTDARAKKLRDIYGVKVFCQCLWSGSDQPPPRVTNLRTALNNGFIIAGYISVTASHDGNWHVAQGRAGVPDDIWDALALVFIDVELDGIPNATVRQAVDATANLGKRRAIYTSYNAWVTKQGNPQDFTDCLLWYALWNEEPEIEWDWPGFRYRFGGWTPDKIAGKQSMGGHNLEGIDVDTDTFVRDLLIPKEENISLPPEIVNLWEEVRVKAEQGKVSPVAMGQVLTVLFVQQKVGELAVRIGKYGAK